MSAGTSTPPPLTAEVTQTRRRQNLPRDRTPLVACDDPPGTLGSEASQVEYYDIQHETWAALCTVQEQLLENRACPQYLNSRKMLTNHFDRVPSLRDVDQLVQARCGWRVVRAIGYVEATEFFSLLAQRKFPCLDLIRNSRELLYTSEPDMFHDILGHLPMLADPLFNEWYYIFGRAGERARTAKQIEYFAKFYWFTMEFGIYNPTTGSAKRDPTQTRAYGAALMTGLGELVNSIGPGVEKKPFSLEAIVRAETDVRKMNDTLFEVSSLENPFEEFTVWLKSERLL